MDLYNRGYFRIFFTDNITITVNDTLIATWIIGAILIALAIIVRIKIKKFKDVPETKFQNIIELIVEMFYNMVVDLMGKKYAHFGNWFFGVFLFVWFANLSGVVGLRPPTADLATTLGLAVTTVVLIQFSGMRYSKKEYWLDFLRPVFIFLPLNIMGEASRIISLSVRLFANIFSGLIMIGLIHYLFPWFLRIGIPGALSIYFDIFVGSLHAYLFVLLSMMFIRLKAPMED
jgi:F-type H+-transporting ATPase subunit a